MKRNRERFPADFMFQLNPREKKKAVTVCDLRKLKFSPTLPFAFTRRCTFIGSRVVSALV